MCHNPKEPEWWVTKEETKTSLVCEIRNKSIKHCKEGAEVQEEVGGWTPV